MEMNTREVETEFNNLMYRFSPVFKSNASFQTSVNYVKGLLSTTTRKNGWQLSEYLGETTPYTIQQFLYRGRFSSDKLRDVLRNYIGEILGKEDGVMVVDETGFLKQGKKSCIPEDLTFQTKPQMALEMIQEATAAGFPYTWVTGDCVYGDYSNIRQWLEKEQKCYVMSVSGKAYIWQGFEQKSVSSILNKLPDEGWFEGSCGDGSKGARLYDWQTVKVNHPPMEGWHRTLLVRRSKTNPDELRAYICFAPLETAIQKFIEVAGTRWTVETCFKESKSEVGLAEYEVRSFEGWYKHITLALIAIAILTALSSLSYDAKRIQEHKPASCSLEDFKKKRNLPA